MQIQETLESKVFRQIKRRVRFRLNLMKPLFRGNFILPPAFGYLLFGLISSNFFGFSTLMAYYPNTFAQHVRIIVFCMILTRGAMSIRIRGMGPILLLITILTGTLEALTAAKLGRTLF